MGNKTAQPLAVPVMSTLSRGDIVLYQGTTYYVVDHFRDKHRDSDVGKVIRAYDYSYVFDGDYDYAYVRAVQLLETDEYVFLDNGYSGLQTLRTSVTGFRVMARNVNLPRTVSPSRVVRNRKTSH